MIKDSAKNREQIITTRINMKVLDLRAFTFYSYIELIVV